MLILFGSASWSCSVHLDGFAYNGTHCSTVGPQTCEDEEEPWDRVCKACDEPYEFDVDYEWVDGTLGDGVASVRAIDPGLVTRHSVPTADGLATLDAYLLAAHGEAPELADITIIHSHGNFANVEHYLPRLRFLHEAGFTVIGWDYRGYGKSEPETHPSSEEFVADARAMWDYAADIVPDATKRIAYGHSLGAIPAIEMAVHGEPCALFIEAPFTSPSQIAKSNSGMTFPSGFVSEGYFENREKLETYTRPLLVMHGTADRTFSTHDVTELYESAAGPKELWLLPGVGHGVPEGVPEAGLRQYFDKMTTFIDQHGGCQ